MPTAPAGRRITAPSVFSTSTASPTRTTGRSARAAITPTKRELRLTADYPPPDKLANKIGQTFKFAMKSRHPRKLAENTPAVSRGGANTREIPASEAKARLPELLDAVERGQTIDNTRHARRRAPP